VTPRFLGVGTALLSEAIHLSREDGHEGRIGLHSLPQAEGFYAQCGMTRVGFDPDYYDLPYYEFTSQQATDWLAAIGESRGATRQRMICTRRHSKRKPASRSPPVPVSRTFGRRW